MDQNVIELKTGFSTHLPPVCSWVRCFSVRGRQTSKEKKELGHMNVQITAFNSANTQQVETLSTLLRREAHPVHTGEPKWRTECVAFPLIIKLDGCSTCTSCTFYLTIFNIYLCSFLMWWQCMIIWNPPVPFLPWMIMMIQLLLYKQCKGELIYDRILHVTSYKVFSLIFQKSIFRIESHIKYVIVSLLELLQATTAVQSLQ